jgi:hypothetical protein
MAERQAIIQQPLLSNGSVNKHVSTVTRKDSNNGRYVVYAVRAEVLQPGPVSSLTRMEAGSNTSTVTLRVVAGDEKGSLKSETVKYGHESKGTRTRE